jgi:hypothetical protein
MKPPIVLSPFKLGLFSECPRCFYSEINYKIHRPKCIFPSLPSGMDKVIKNYYDQYRIQDKLPPEIRETIKGKLIKEESLLKKWRNNFQGLQYFNKNINVLLKGILDDCVIDKNIYIPLDYKTRGYELKEDTALLYKKQIGVYCYLLYKNGFKKTNFGYLVFYYPKSVKENGLVNFNVEPIKVEIDLKEIENLICGAANCVNGPEPSPNKDCEFCSWSTKTQLPLKKVS